MGLPIGPEVVPFWDYLIGFYISFLGLPHGFLNMSHKKELLRGL